MQVFLKTADVAKKASLSHPAKMRFKVPTPNSKFMLGETKYMLCILCSRAIEMTRTAYLKLNFLTICDGCYYQWSEWPGDMSGKLTRLLFRMRSYDRLIGIGIAKLRGLVIFLRSRFY